MTPQTIARLNALNRAFYAATAAEFSATRQSPWLGWAHALPHLAPARRVLDVGCGNGRFGLYLRQQIGESVGYHGLDNSPELLAEARHVLPSGTFGLCDVVEDDLPPDPTDCDAVVLFGVLHHLPGFVTRQRVVRALAQRLTSNGVLIVSAWQFLDDDGLRARVVPWPPDLAGEVEDGDALLDWRRGVRALRYCHHTSALELGALFEGAGLHTVATWHADGASGRLNLYAVGRRAG